MGLSGGIDSSLVAALCKKGLGDNVLGAIMPCESASRDEGDALKFAERLGMKTVTVRLDAVYSTLLQVLGKDSKLARANLKPRLRMAALYFLANTRAYLVAGTGNKSEIMTGYFTKYGDGGVDFLPLGSLYKTEVRELARELDLPEDIIDKPPSAGLWDGQTDERELGISYEELDRSLLAVETGNMEDVNSETVRKVEALVAGSAHKRSSLPVFEVA